MEEAGDSKFSGRCDVVTFVQEIEKHPCLYDTSSSDYSNRTMASHDAWAEIASKLQSTIPDCKHKWRKIRIAYMRSMKQLRRKNSTTKPYYLSRNLEFLLPFIKFEEPKRNPSPATSSEDDQVELEVEIPKEENISDSEDENEIENGNAFTNHTVFLPNCNDNRKRKDSLDIRKIGAKRKPGYDRISARKMFLLSILPDVESFSEQEMRVFRREVVTCIDNIMTKREND